VVNGVRLRSNLDKLLVKAKWAKDWQALLVPPLRMAAVVVRVPVAVEAVEAVLPQVLQNRRPDGRTVILA